MMNKTRILVIVIAMTVIFVGAQASKRNTFSFDMSAATYQKPRLPRNYYSEQPFIDKMVEQRTLPDIPTRSRNIRQQVLRDLSFADQTIYPPSFPSFRHRSFKQNFIHRIPMFDDQSFLKDTSLRNQELRDGRAIFRDNPFEGTLQDIPFSSDEIFKAQELMYRNQGPFKEQLSSIVETPFKKLLRGQLSSGEQASFPMETAFVEYPSFPNSIKPYREESYNKPISSYGRQKDGNQALGISSSMSMVSSGNHHLPFNAEIPTTTPSILTTTTHEPDSRISSASAVMTKVNPSDAFKTKFGRTSTLDGSFNMLVDSSSAMFSDTFPTVPSISVSANQSSVVGHILTSLTTESSLPVMATKTPIALFIENSLAPIYFHTTKHGTVMTPSIQSELKNNVHALSYLLAQVPRNSFTIDEYNLKYLMPEVSKNNMKTDIQTPVLNYILPDGYKSESKSNIQNSFVNCAQPEGFKHSWPLQQQFSQPDTLSSYAPLPLNGNVKLILPSIQVAPLSPISWPIEMKREIPIKFPAKSLVESDPSTASSNLPLGINLPLNFVTNIPNSLTSSIPNSITGSISSGITTNIPGSMTADMSAGIPALNLGQHLHRMEQLRQIQDARNSWYPTGI